MNRLTRLIFVSMFIVCSIYLVIESIALLSSLVLGYSVVIDYGLLFYSEVIILYLVTMIVYYILFEWGKQV